MDLKAFHPRKAPIGKLSQHHSILSLALIFLISITAGLLKGQTKIAANDEYIILSGGPALRTWEELRREEQQHDRWWGNFIRSARIRVQQLQKDHGDQIPITWLVYKQGYLTRQIEDNAPLIANILSVRDKFRINLVWYDSGQDVINYLNSGKNRSTTKIAGFEFFGHSNLKCFLLDYGNNNLGASRSYLHENQLYQINRNVFRRYAYCKSWGCHSGESFCRAFRRATGVRMIGARGKTDYSVLKDMQLPVVSPPGKWIMR